MGRASCYTITSEKQTQCLAEAVQSKRGVENDKKYPVDLTVLEF